MSVVTIDTEGMTERERRDVERGERAARRRDFRVRYREASDRVPHGQRTALLAEMAANAGMKLREAELAAYGR